MILYLQEIDFQWVPPKYNFYQGNIVCKFLEKTKRKIGKEEIEKITAGSDTKIER